MALLALADLAKATEEDLQSTDPARNCHQPTTFKLLNVLGSYAVAARQYWQATVRPTADTVDSLEPVGANSTASSTPPSATTPSPAAPSTPTPWVSPSRAEVTLWLPALRFQGRNADRCSAVTAKSTNGPPCNCRNQ